jgi:hypothetical protein
MRLGLAFALVGVLAGASAAAPWPGLVGDYTAKLTWTGCSAPGVRSATLSLDATDGALAIDLAPARGGLYALSLVEDEGGTLSAQQADITLALAPVKAGLALSIDLASGCRIRGTLVRAASKVAACARQDALARIAARCTKLDTRPAMPSGRWMAKDAPACTRRADALETQLVDAGCLPSSTPEQMALVCQQVLAEAQKLKRCPNASPDAAIAAERLMGAARPASDPAQREATELGCRRAHVVLADFAARSRCPL